jgi:hypothetical protein
MGLPDGREQEIKKEIIKLVASCDDYVDVMEQITVKLTDEAELAYAFFAIGELAGTVNPEQKELKDTINSAVMGLKLLNELEKKIKTAKASPKQDKNPIKWE